MTSYRVSRRAVLSGLGGALGLHILLRNLEAAAEGATSPPRFLMMHWPDGTSRYRFLPTGGRTDFTISPILKPFIDAGLRNDLIVLYGLSHPNTGIGRYEAGTVFATTGANSPGVRQQSDTSAGGPSFDQIFLKRAPRLAAPGPGYVNTICDARVVYGEIATQCLSYSYERRDWSSTTGAQYVENVPLKPILRPLDTFTHLFSSMVPGGMTTEQALKTLRKRKSVLDSALRELKRLETLAPSSQAEKIDAHTEAIRKLETELSQQIDKTTNTPECPKPLAPDPALSGLTGNGNYYGRGNAEKGDEPWLQQVGALHLQLIRTAFQCDLTRVATFQWCPGASAVAFEGMYPADPAGAYRFHPMSHNVGGVEYDVAPSGEPNPIVELLCNVWTWFNEKTAAALAAFKTTTDAFGNSLLDHTVVPFITETHSPAGGRTGLPALIFGGKKLGMIGNQFVNLSPATPQNAMWLAIAQAYFPGQDPAQVLADETFMNSGAASVTTPIEGLWKAPT